MTGISLTLNYLREIRLYSQDNIGRDEDKRFIQL